MLYFASQNNNNASINIINNLLLQPFQSNKKSNIYSFTRPEGIVWDISCNLYIGNRSSCKQNGYVTKFSSNNNNNNNNIVTTLSLPDNASVRQLEVDNSNNLYIADFNNKNIIKFTYDGQSCINYKKTGAWGLAYDNIKNILYKSTGINS